MLVHWIGVGSDIAEHWPGAWLADAELNGKGTGFVFGVK
jgi:hypothetical protein